MNVNWRRATDGITRRSVLASATGVAAVGTVGTRTAAARDGCRDELEVVANHPVEGAKEVIVEGQHAYVATTGVREENGNRRRFGGIAIVDWSDPASPHTVQRLELPRDEFPTPETLDVKVDGDVAGLANDTNFPDPGGVAFYDVSDPASAEQVSFYDSNASIHNHFIDGDFAYLCVNEPTWIDSDEDPELDRVRIFGETGIEVVDISDPTRPARAARWKLKDERSSFAEAAVNNSHDLYVQDDLAYVAYWDAGIIVLDVSDPSDPQMVSQFGDAPEADEPVRPLELDGDPGYFETVFPTERFYGSPGNAHFVQPSPDGDYVFVGAETFTGAPGGIDVWDVTDLDAPEKVAEIDPPAGGGEIDPEEQLEVTDRETLLRLHTSHNFDVTEDRLHTSWYGGGVRVFDVSDPTAPSEIGAFAREDTTFWTAVTEGEFTIASDIDRGIFVFRGG